MAPIKFEENIKEKLERRELEPSSQAWNRLSNRLEADTKKPSNKIVLLLGIAASVIGILFMVNMFLNTSETQNIEPILVDTETKEIEIFKDESNKESNETFIAIQDDEMEVEKIPEEKMTTQKAKKKTMLSKNQEVKNTNIAQVESKQKSEGIIKNSVNEASSNELELAIIESEENTKNAKTDIDALLKEAQQKLKHSATEKSYAIDAKALLQDVETDLEESFRAKMFETLIAGFNKVKTAVVERND